MNPNIIESRLFCYNKAMEPLMDEIRLMSQNNHPGKNVQKYLAKRAKVLLDKIEKLDERYGGLL